MWHCVEDRVENGSQYGRIIRKIIFGDIFASRSSVIQQRPIPATEQRLLQRGDTVAYLDESEIRETQYLCSSDGHDAKFILTQLLTTEDDLKCFCRTNKLSTKGLHLMLIEAFEHLTHMKTGNQTPVNTESTNARKRPLATQLVARTSILPRKIRNVPTKAKQTHQTSLIRHESDNDDNEPIDENIEVIEVNEPEEMPTENVKIELTDQVS